MSVDKTVTKNLMEVLEDGREGFADAATKLRDSDRPGLAIQFEEFSRQRASLYDELERTAALYGDDAEESGSAKAAMHRIWMSVKDTLSGSDPDGILDAAEQGEDHAVKKYQEALNEDISGNLRTIVEQQYVKIQAAHDAVRAARDSVK